MPSAFTNVELYGGALTVSLPADFTDVSALRDVPDNQEVYVSRTGLTSIIFDVLERAEPPDHPCRTDDEALEYHYSDVVEQGHGREGRDMQEQTTVMGGAPANLKMLPDVPAYRTLRIQSPTAPPIGAEQVDFTGVLLTLVRLEKQKTDLLVTVNVPHVKGEYESVDLHAGKVGPLLEAGTGYMDRVLETLKVVDWGLFDG